MEGKQMPKVKAKDQPKKKEVDDLALKGWKARDCAARVKDGILRVTNIGATCFLGFGAGKHRGPSTLKVRIKAKAGTSHVDWIPGGAGGGTQRADFQLQEGGAWQEISVPLPATGPLGIVRFYLPMQEEPVEIDWIVLNEEKTDF